MFCPNCGMEIPEGSNFCPYCAFKIVSEGKAPTAESPAEEAIKNLIIRRIEGIKNRDPKVIESLAYPEKYTKFDDWPPWDLQSFEAIKNEAEALKVLKEYSYETRAWRTEIFGECALAMFIIGYRGKIRDHAFNIRSRVTVFLAKHKGEWKIVHEHWSRFLQ